MNTVKEHKFYMERNLDLEQGIEISNKELINCIFDNCHIGTRDDITKLSIFRNIDMIDCSLLNCLIGPVILEDITIKNLKTGDIAIFNLPLLKHIKIEGKIGKIKINNIGFNLMPTLEEKKKMIDMKNSFYQKVDWAIDISNAEFLDFFCLGIPTNLFKINPEHQFIANRDKIIESSILSSKFINKNIVLNTILQLFIESEENDMVLVAPLAKAKKYREPILSDLQKLRQEKIIS